MSLSDIAENKLIKMLEMEEVSLDDFMDKTSRSNLKKILYKLINKSLHSSQPIDCGGYGKIYIAVREDNENEVIKILQDNGLRTWDNYLDEYSIRFDKERIWVNERWLNPIIKKYMLSKDYAKHNFIHFEYIFGVIIHILMNNLDTKNLIFTQIEDILFIDFNEIHSSS